jgi:hypothetical protein
MAYTERQINAANHTNMYEYMSAHGANWVHFSANEMMLAEHDSMKATLRTGVVNWYSRGIKSFNNSVEFAQAVYPELSFDDTVKSLLEFNEANLAQTEYHGQTKAPVHQQEPFNIEKIQQLGDGTKITDAGKLNKKGLDYLTEKRFLNPELVNTWAKAGLISSDTMGNVIFKWKEHGETVGADQQGIYKRPLEKRMRTNGQGELQLNRPYYKGIGVNSQTNGGFKLWNLTGRAPGEAVSLYVTEAPIEALSLMELNNRAGINGTAHYLSMSGLKKESVYNEIQNMRKMYGRDTPIKVVLATNTDEPGQKFIRDCVHRYGDRSQQNNVKWSYLQPRFANSDWNEMLEYQKTGRLDSRLEKQQDLTKSKTLFELQKAHNNGMTQTQTLQKDTEQQMQMQMGG